MSQVTEQDKQSHSGSSLTILRNASIITVGALLLRLLNFLFRIYVIRTLGSNAFGQYSIVLAFVGLFQIFAELGISQYAVRELTRNRANHTLVWDLIAIRLILAFIGVVIIPLIAVVVGYPQQITFSIFLFTWTFVIAAFEAPLETLLTAHERLDYVTWLGIVGQLSFAAFATYVLWRGYGVVMLVAVGLLGMLPQFALAIWLVHRHRLIHGPIRFSIPRWRSLLVGGLPFGMISLALTISFGIDTVMLSFWWPAEVVGWYNVAYGLARTLLIVFTGFSRALVPTLSRIFVHDRNYVSRWYRLSIRLIALIGLPLAVGGMLVGNQLIPFLYGSEYLPAILSFRIIVWDVPFLLFTSLCGNITTAIDEEHGAARIYGASAVANVVLNLIFIPHYGLIAASIITVITDIVGMFLFHFLIRRKLNAPLVSILLPRIILAAAAMGGILVTLGSQPLFILLGAGVGSYFAALLLFHAITWSELAQLWAISLRLFGRRVPVTV